MSPSPPFSTIGTKWQTFVVFGIIGLTLLLLNVFGGIVLLSLFGAGAFVVSTTKKNGSRINLDSGSTLVPTQPELLPCDINGVCTQYPPQIY